MYADNEDILGTWFKNNPGKREKVFLATKFANAMDKDGNRYIDSSPEYATEVRVTPTSSPQVNTKITRLSTAH